jgi:hypothetical protein
VFIFGVHAELPSQRPRRRPVGAAQRLAVALLVEAYRTAGLLADRRYRVTASMRRAARAWLVGAVDDEVAVSVGWCCDALGIDPGALADVAQRCG